MLLLAALVARSGALRRRLRDNTLLESDADLLSALMHMNGFGAPRFDKKCGAEFAHAGCDPTSATPCCEGGRCVASAQCVSGHDHSQHVCNAAAWDTSTAQGRACDHCATPWQCTRRDRTASAVRVAEDAASLKALSGEALREVRLLLRYRGQAIRHAINANPTDADEMKRLRLLAEQTTAKMELLSDPTKSAAELASSAAEDIEWLTHLGGDPKKLGAVLNKLTKEAATAAPGVCVNLEELHVHGDITGHDLGTKFTLRGEHALGACCHHCAELTDPVRGIQCTGFIFVAYNAPEDENSYCYLKGFKGPRPPVPSKKHFAVPGGIGESGDNRRVYLMPGTIDLAYFRELQTRERTKLETPVCREFGAPYTSTPNTMDAAESAWETARQGGATDGDVEQRKAHMRAVLSTHAFAPFGSSREWSEAESWNRFDFTKCCGDVAPFHMVNTVTDNVGSVGKQNCPGTDWAVCATGGKYDFDEAPRWEGSNGYDRFISLAFASRTEAATLPRSSHELAAAEVGQAGRPGIGNEGEWKKFGDPVLDHTSLLPMFPHFPIALNGDILTEEQLHDTPPKSAVVTDRLEDACVRVVETTPLSNFAPAAVKAFGNFDRAVTSWARKLPGWAARNGSSFVVNNCFVYVMFTPGVRDLFAVPRYHAHPTSNSNAYSPPACSQPHSDSTWGQNFCEDLNSDCGMTAHFVSDDAFVHKSSIHCRGYRPFFDIAMPLPTDWRWVEPEPHAAGLKLRSLLLRGDNDVTRSVLMFFKGGKTEQGLRHDVVKLHDPSRKIIAVGSHDTLWPYGETMQDSRFAAAPRGAGLDSYRLSELMQYGCIPVIISDGYVLPFASLLDWRKFSIAVPENAVATIPDILEAIDVAAQHRMARHAAFVWEEFLSSKQRIAAVALAVLQRNVERAKAHFGGC